MGKKKYAIVITEEINGKMTPSTVYADSVSDAMNYINLINNKKVSIKILENDEKLIFKEKEEIEKEDKKKNNLPKGQLFNHGNGHWDQHDENEHGHGHEHHNNGHHNGHDDDDDDYHYA